MKKESMIMKKIPKTHISALSDRIHSDQMSANVYKTKKHEYVLALMYIKTKMIVNMLA